jgi:hypothetical protein
MPKVYVTQEVSYADYQQAERFGEVVFLCTSEVSNITGSLHNKKLLNVIRERFRAYDPEVDYIAPSGSPIITCLVMAFAREKGTTFNFLKWSNRDRQYSQVTFDLKETGHVL